MLGTAIGVYVESTKDAEDETSKFQEKIRETRAAVNEYKDSMSQLSEEREMAIAKSESEFSYYAGLKTELDGIVEKNGKIKDGYEQRAKTITTILSDALGVEMEINGGVISGYEKLSDSIDEVIEKKRAEAFISAKEPEYKKAIETEQTLLKNLTIARKNLNSAEERYLEAKKSGNQEMITSTRTVHEELKKIYDQALADYEKNNEIIKDVESDMAAFEEGHYEQIYSTYENGEKAISSLTLEEAKKRLEMVRSEKDASLQIYKETGSETARVTAENYGKEENSLLLHISEMSNIVARDTKFIDSIKKLAKEGYSAFESVPWGNVGNEIINGVDGGMRKQIEKLRNTALYISGQILNSFRSSLKMNSPSKLMRDEVGIPISEGIAVGEEQGIPFIKKANKSIVREISNLQMPPKKINYLFENITPIKPAPFMMSQGRPIDVTVYSVLDGKIISKTVQKDISRSQEMRMRAKGAAT